MLERLLRGQGVLRHQVEISRRPDGAVVPISAEQEHVWLHANLAPDVPLYNEAITIHRQAACDPALLAASLNEVVRRHEIWRTDFTLRDGRIVQNVHKHLPVEVPFVDLTTTPEADRAAAALAIATEDARLPFDLGRAPLLRARIVKLDDTDHRLYITLHHIIFDGVSIYNVLLPTLASVYRQLADAPRTQAPAPPATELQYGDYAVWRASQLETGALARQLSYWRDIMAGDLPVLRLPGDRQAPAVPSHRGGMETFVLPNEIADRLQSMSLRLGVTKYVLLLTCFETMLFRYTGQTDLIVGGVADMRRHRALEPLMGYFLNSLPIRTGPRPEMSFRDYARQTSGAVLGMLDACDVPLSHLVRELHPHRTAATHPLFQVLFSIEPPTPAFPDGWDLTQMDVPVASAKFDLYLELEDGAAGLIGRFLYSTDLFDPSTIRRMIGHWIAIIESVLGDPDCTLAELRLLTPDEIAQLAVWNATGQAVPHATLHGLFEAQVRAAPDAPAVVSSERSCSYDELGRQADRIAGWLNRAGVQAGALVGVCVERSVDLLACLLGVMKAGGAYMPLDPAQPQARLAACLDQAAATFLITRRGLLASGALPAIHLLLLDDFAEPKAPAALPCQLPASEPRDLAYVLCTSGTTGKPKAVEITHRAVVNLLLAMRGIVGFDATGSLLAITTISFDIAGLELFLPLLSGGRVVLAGRDIAGDAWRLAEYIGQTRPSLMQATPSTLRALVDAGWKGLAGMKLIAGGEALPRGLADALLPGLAGIWNAYGPTETTIWSTVHRVRNDHGDVPIGRPIANTTAFVVDAQGNQLPVGVRGELCLGGMGVARGYRGLDALTSERFAILPASSGQRVYRTGDIVSLDGNGELHWFGRNDDQLKIRGHRVEPGEIEAVLTALPGVRSAAVVAHLDASHSLQLVAHVVAPGSDAERLRGQAALRLPAYMVPGRFQFHDALKLNANGKIDRKQLPTPETVTAVWRAPQTETEKSLVEIWKEVLGLSHIDTAADFFSLGGHSLLAMRLLGLVETKFGRRIGLAALFRYPTIESFARVIEDGQPRARPGSASHRRPAVSLPASGDLPHALELRMMRPARGISRGIVLGMPSMVGHAAVNGVIAANAFQDYDMWTFALDIGGGKLIEGGRWLDCVQEIVARLSAADGLRPRAFLGFSLGGFIGWLVDRLLVAAGGDATPVINFDGGAGPYLPKSMYRARIDELLPDMAGLPASRMLLLHRRSPGKFVLNPRAEGEWARAGVTPQTLSYRTLDHRDVFVPSAVAACAEALNAFIETGQADPASCLDRLEFDTVGGTAFRMLSAATPPTPDAVRRLLGRAWAKDLSVRGYILLLTVATGDAEMAMDLARDFVAKDRLYRPAAYALVALLAQLGRRRQAIAIADEWCRSRPLERNMRAVARRAPLPPVKWGSVERLVIGSDASMDFAVRLLGGGRPWALPLDPTKDKSLEPLT